MIKNNDKSKPYSHPRWNDKQLPVVTGHIEFSEEGKERKGKEPKRVFGLFKEKRIQGLTDNLIPKALCRNARCFFNVVLQLFSC